MIKLADEISAFLEAYQSIEHGIKSKHLKDGKDNIYYKYMEKGLVCGINVRKFFLENLIINVIS